MNIDHADAQKISYSIRKGKAKLINEAVMSIKTVKRVVNLKFFQYIDYSQCQDLCVQKRGTPSKLTVKETFLTDALMSFFWESND